MRQALPDQFLLEKFIDGLKEEIRFDVMTLHPIDFKEAISLGKVFKWKNTSKKKLNLAIQQEANSKTKKNSQKGVIRKIMLR